MSLDGTNDTDPMSTDPTQTGVDETATNAANGVHTVSILEQQAEKERNSGICEFIHRENPGFTGILKQR